MFKTHHALLLQLSEISETPCKGCFYSLFHYASLRPTIQGRSSTQQLINTRSHKWRTQSVRFINKSVPSVQCVVLGAPLRSGPDEDALNEPYVQGGLGEVGSAGARLNLEGCLLGFMCFFLGGWEGWVGGGYGLAPSALVSACHIKTVPLGGRWNPVLCCKRTVRPSLWRLSGLVPESCVHAVILTSHLTLSNPLPPVAALGFLNGNDCETTTTVHKHTRTNTHTHGTEWTLHIRAPAGRSLL